MRIYIMRADGKVQRYHVKNRGAYEKTGKKKNRANVWKKKEKARKRMVFRSLLSNMQSSEDENDIEYRVYVHTNEEILHVSDELDKRMLELIDLYPLFDGYDKNDNPIYRTPRLKLDKEEKNEPIDADEIDPTDAKIGEWLGFVQFSTKKYFARGFAGQMEKVSKF